MKLINYMKSFETIMNFLYKGTFTNYVNTLEGERVRQILLLLQRWSSKNGTYTFPSKFFLECTVYNFFKSV